jgi:uridylate kinase
MAVNELWYRRIVVKFSGEALVGKDGFGIDNDVVLELADEIFAIQKMGVQIGIVVGGGNFFRGAQLFKHGLDRITSDQMGMMATIINAIAMRDLFTQKKIKTEVMSSFELAGMVPKYDRHQAIKLLEAGNALILAGGTGNPLVTTDSALSLRGIELGADLLIKATNVDGIYDSDPRKNPKAKMYSRLTYDEALAKEIAVMDLASFYQCREHKMKLRVYNISKPEALSRIVVGEDEGTFVEVG